MIQSNPPLKQLRFWLRHDQADRVLEALEGREATCSPQEQAVMALAMTIFTLEKLDADGPLSALPCALSLHRPLILLDRPWLKSSQFRAAVMKFQRRCV